MSSEWAKYKLIDVCKYINRGITPSYVDDGICVVNQKCIRDGRLNLKESRQSNSSKKIPNDKLLNHLDVLVNSTGQGTLGRVAQVLNKVERPMTVDSHVTVVRPNTKFVNPRFFGFLVRGLQQEIESLAEGSTGQTELSRIKLGNLDIKLPSLLIQSQIATILSALDDRITLLRETNATLEAIAQALFKSWFVDFDPVHAKMQGTQPEGMDEQTAALFPDSFDESVVGLVPAGWEVKTIGDVVEIVGGGTPDTKEVTYWEPSEHCWTTPKDLSGNKSPILLNTDRKISTKGLKKVGSGLLPKGTLLMSSRAPIGYLAIAQVPLAINQGYIAILENNSKLPPLYMLFWCQQNMESIKGRANGSTFMEISKKAFRPISVLTPPQVIIHSFVNVASALFDSLVTNEEQAQTLADLRDTLLPRLISGQLQVGEI